MRPPRDAAAMRRLALPLLLLCAAPASARDALGVFEGWGAFRDAAPPRCYAIAMPAGRTRGGAWRAFASVATWPAAGVRRQLHIRFHAARGPNAAIALAVGEQRFALVGGGADAWAPDARGDAAIVAAMRSAASMSVETRGADGRPMVDAYRLRGAATAIDAAALACGRR